MTQQQRSLYLTQLGALIPGLALVGAVLLALFAPDAPPIGNPSTMMTGDEAIQLDLERNPAKS